MTAKMIVLQLSHRWYGRYNYTRTANYWFQIISLNSFRMAFGGPCDPAEGQVRYNVIPSLFCQEGLVGGDQLQVRGGCDVVVPL